MEETPASPWRTSVHENPTLGRVLEVALVGPMSPVSWDSVREVLRKQVADQRPEYLVIDLRPLDSVYGVALLGALVVGAAAMEKRGLRQRTKLLAGGDIARRLPRILKISKIESLFGGRVYSDLESALTRPANGAS